MSPSHLQRNPTLREKLASEYVLGTLRGSARRRFEHWLQEDSELRTAVSRWETRLSPLAEFVPGVAPSQQVWRGIEKQLGLASQPVARTVGSSWSNWFDSLRFWRALGMASTAVAAMLIAVLLMRATVVPVAVPMYVATLTDDKSVPIAVASSTQDSAHLTVRFVSRQAIGPDRSLELWAVPKSGHPQSLGLLKQDGTIAVNLPQNMTPDNVPLLAISLEPKGGSPNPNGPSGPILFKGAWVRT